MKESISNFVKRYILNHQVNSITANKENEVQISFSQLNPLIGKRNLIIKDRNSGRRVKKVIKNNKGTFDLQEVFEICNSGSFDLYVTFNLLNRKFSRRVPYNNLNRPFELVDRNNHYKLRSFKTVNNNLSFSSQRIACQHMLTEIKSVGHNFYLAGEIENFSDNKLSKVELIVQRRDNKRCYGYKCELQEVNEDIYRFNCILFTDKLKKDLILNSRWDVFIQARNEEDIIIYKELVNLQKYKKIVREEERYLENVLNNEQNIVSLYATMGKESLAIWYTDQVQFEKTYNIAKGKSVFNQTCESEKLDEQMIFFESFFGKNYSGNPKYIYEEMLRDDKYKNYKFVWSYSGESHTNLPGNPIIVKRETEEYYKYLAKSKYWVSNILFPVQRKREGNIYLQTWHGTPLKKLGFDIDIEGPETLARENFYIESRNWDYLISANSYSSKIFKRAFKFNKEVLEVGYPANDIFYKSDLEDQVNKIKKKLNIPSHKKVILYAPTWRDNEATNSWEHSFELKFSLDEFYKKFKDEYVLILRMHHLVADALQIKDEHKSTVLELSKYDDIQELYTISDILVTDYSSVFFDYANSRKPMLFFGYDFEEYKDEIRGFYLDMEKDLPGPVIQTGPELLKAIENIDLISDEYKEKYDEFYEKFCGLEDGKAAQRVITEVFQK
ncbi:CDP-glycerol glycerophosphotransferase family protein [Bacillus mobilis]|uniref:CDP-glycerol glycerophosphotransferase family protein n=1 Tax=Bacillus mobilis TaxID=2026190 RepID=UPI002E243C4F|nr:CDP-glycerol glycerophosphotransferase family protein [Bacillus mobilis]